ncbi:hypothetical protein D3C71_1491600 [compost metagenome]
MQLYIEGKPVGETLQHDGVFGGVIGGLVVCNIQGPDTDRALHHGRIHATPHAVPGQDLAVQIGGLAQVVTDRQHAGRKDPTHHGAMNGNQRLHGNRIIPHHRIELQGGIILLDGDAGPLGRKKIKNPIRHHIQYILKRGRLGQILNKGDGNGDLLPRANIG